MTRNKKAKEKSLVFKLPRRKVHLASGLDLTCIAKPAARREAGNTKRKGRLMRPGPGMAHSPASGTPMSAIYAYHEATARTCACICQSTPRECSFQAR